MEPPALTASAPIVAVCGLHGGAGTTATAITLARHAVAQAGPGAVLLTETDPRGGGLALALDAAGPYALSDLGHHRAAGATPSTMPLTQLPDGLRLVAAPPAERLAADAVDVAAVLRDAGAAHAMTVIDCGSIAADHAAGAFEAATSLVWVAAAHTPSSALAALLRSPLTRPARHLRAVLAVCDHAGTAARPTLRELRSAAPTAAAIVLIPHTTPQDLRRHDAARDLIVGLAA